MLCSKDSVLRMLAHQPEGLPSSRCGLFISLKRVSTQPRTRPPEAAALLIKLSLGYVFKGKRVEALPTILAHIQVNLGPQLQASPLTA